MLAGELLLPVYHKITPADTGIMLSAGVETVQVLKKPRVIIIPTGSELVEPGTTPAPGEIIDSNSSLFASQVKEWGGEAIIHPLVEDDLDEIGRAVGKSADEADLVLISAGSSAGRKDYTSKVVEEQGKLLIHGVAVRPGKPVVLGLVKNAAVAGVPGYPVSAYLAMDQFVKPLLYQWQRQPVPQREVVNAKLSRRVVSSLKEDEYLRVVTGNVDERCIAVPLQRGAGVLSSVVKADGWVHIPQSKEGIETGSEVEVELFKTGKEIKNNILCAGSHDMCLDLLHNLLRSRYPEYSLNSAHLGSMGGIMAIKRKEAHLAPVHLLDPDTGAYNIPYLQQYLPDEKVALVHMLYREQGIMVARGNPYGIRGIEDIIEKQLRFINRQKGSGTRILLDYELDKKGLSPESIPGYHREEYNHLAVAAAVSTGTVDAGLGIMAAAKAYHLEFIPLTRESYQLVIPHKMIEDPKIKRTLEVIASEDFARQVESLGGYDTSDRGKVVWESS